MFKDFENKVLLSISTHIVAEQHLVAELAEPIFADGITGDQTQALFRACKTRELGTSESLHVLLLRRAFQVNSFM